MSWDAFAPRSAWRAWTAHARHRSSAGSNAIRAARFPARAKGEAARSAWRCSPRCSPRKAPTCGRCPRARRRWRRSRPISAPAICRRASAWGGMRSSPRSPGATPGTSSGRSDRRGRATGPHCRAPWWPRRKLAPCSWCQAPANPTTLNFLPEAHTVLIEAADIVGSYEEAWDRLRAIHGKGTLPRAVNLISGPSRTADIEQTIVRGAHGPRRLLVLILG